MQRLLLSLVCLMLLATAAWSSGGRVPVAVSPGTASGLVLVADSCPTFSWVGVDRATSQTLTVYEVTEYGQLGQAVIRQALPAGASAWTVPAGRCLARGATYAWTVAATRVHEETMWWEPVVFKVTARPTEVEFRQALAVVRSYLTDESEVTAEMHHEPEIETEMVGVEVVEGSVPAAPAATQLSADGNVDATSFTGDGTNLGGIATDAELTTHTGISAAHHTKTVDTTCSGAACDGTNFTNIQWGNLANRPPGLDDGDDDITYAAGPGLALTGTTFSLSSGPALAPMNNTISTVDSVGNVGYYTSITLGADGLPVVSYYDGAPNYDLKVAKCTDAACSSATLSTLDSAGDVGLYTSIILGADGLPVVSYYDETNADLKVAKCSDVACSSANLSTVDSTGNVGTWTSITLGADGQPVVSYVDGSPNFDLKVAKCHDAACSSATLSTVDSAARVDYTSITLGGDGLPVVSYRDGSAHDLKVAKCHDAACSSATISTVDSAGSVGGHPSITLGADGLPVVSYLDLTNIDLKVAKCTDAACSSAILSTVDNAGDVGWYTSITLGTDGLPVVSYYDSTPNHDLKVARCHDAACYSATLSTVDSAGNVGSRTSITLGADGLPVVSYFDVTYGDLKVAHCGSASCVPYLRRR